MTTQLPAAVQQHIKAVNSFDIDGVLATFAPDALVNDNHREFRGSAEIRAFVAKEIVGDRVTMDVVDVPATGGLGITVVRARYDGDYDKTNLPDELILTNYFVVRDELITALFIIFNNG